ncbi:MAG: ABC transporter permease [Prochlorotrichaceae cyanobacterium]|jgi:putative ABC transport system permease protein
MHWLESFSMATRALAANRLRSTLTMLGIIIGNSSVIAMIGIGQGARQLAADEFESLGPNVLFVVPGNRQTRRMSFEIPPTLVLSDAEAIATQVPSVKEVAPQISGRAVVSYRGNNSSSQVFGVTPSYLTVRSFNVAQGRFISNLDLKRNERIATLGSDLATKLFQAENPLGKRLRIKGVSFQIVGVMEPKGAFLGTNQDDAVFIPLSTMANRIRGRTSPYGMELSFISVSALDEASIGAAEFQMTNLLRLRHKISGEDDFEVSTQKDVLETVGAITGALTILLAAIAAISLLVGGIGIMNIMLVSVSERTQEIGLRKAIGANQGDILSQFLIEAVILSATGGILGSSLGIGVVYLAATLTPLKASISLPAIVLAVGVSGGIGLFFGVVPAQRAAKLDPIVALRTA